MLFHYAPYMHQNTGVAGLKSVASANSSQILHYIFSVSRPQTVTYTWLWVHFVSGP